MLVTSAEMIRMAIVANGKYIYIPTLKAKSEGAEDPPLLIYLVIGL